MGIQTILYGGICRHQSAMLCDIYTKSKLDSVLLLGYLETIDDDNNLKKDRLQEIVQETLKDRIEGLNDETKQMFLEIIVEEYRKSIGRLPNHAIAMVGKDKKYYLDPANKCSFYRNNDNELNNSLEYTFFVNTKAYKVCYEDIAYQNYNEIYNRILEKNDSTESEDNARMKEIYSYLNGNMQGMASFLISKDNLINNMKVKALTLRK